MSSNLRVFEAADELDRGLAEAVTAVLSREIRPRVLDLRKPPGTPPAGFEGEWLTSPGDASHLELVISPAAPLPAEITTPRLFLVPLHADALEQGRWQPVAEETDVWWFVTREFWTRLGGLERPLGNAGGSR